MIRRAAAPVAVGLVGTGPVIASAVRLAPGWIPTSDVAVLTVRSQDVLSRHLPLLGMPSTASEVGVQVHHPGPLQLWATGLARAVWDGPATPLVVAVAVGLISTVVALVLVHRRWGLTASAGTAAAFALLGWSLRGEVLASPFNPYVGLLPFAAYLVALLAVTEGVPGAGLAAVLLGSWSAQVHLAYPGPVVAAAAVAALVVLRRRGWSWTAARRAWPMGLALALCWSGPVADLVLHRGGNLAAVLERDGGESLGLGSAVGVLVRSLGPRPAPTQAGAGPLTLLVDPDPLAWAIALLVLGALVAVAARGRTGATRTGAGLVIAGLAATTLLLSQIPDLTFNTLALHNYLPLWPLVLLGWAILLVEGTRAVAQRWPHRLPAGGAGTAVALAGGAALVVLSAIDLHRPTAEVERDQVRSVGPLVAAAVDRDQRLAVHVDPYFEPFAIQTGVIAHLDRLGMDIRVPAEQAAAFGDHRVADGTDPTLWVSIDHPDAGSGGEVVARTTVTREDGTRVEVVATLLPPAAPATGGTLTSP